ncbi:MAG: VWA domain-containing protein [Bdellovibrionales bacterium]|nr:VWA domain-containing protein [Bdellovibrionales bacterium]
MNEFHFQNPAYLAALLLVPALWLVARLTHRWAEVRLAKFASAKSLAALLVGAAGQGGTLRGGLLALGIAFLVVALARPQGNPVEESQETSGLDLMVLLDVSRSMDAEDVFPSRLKKAKKSISSLMERLSGDRIGVVAFAGSAVVVSPLTTDYEAVRTFLESVDTSLIENQGTDLEHAVSVALRAMSRGGVNQTAGGESSNIFVVMSDGETHTEKVDRAAESAKSASTRIFTIAFGTEKGAPIPIRDQGGELRGYKKDDAGEPVITKAEASALRTLANTTGGTFYHSTFDEGEISDILRRTEGFTRGLKSEKKIRIYEEYFQIPLEAASVLLLLSVWPGSWLPRRSRRVGDLVMTVILFAVLPGVALGAPWDSRARRRSEEARALLEQGKAEEARKIYEELQVDHPEAPELAHNLGLALTLEGRGEDARRQLEGVRKSPWALSGDWNHAGSYAVEKKSREALAEFSRIVMDLDRKQNRSIEENAALVQARKNLEFLARQNQEKKDQKQQQGGQNSEGDQKKNQQDSEDSGDQKKKQPSQAPQEGSGKKPFQEREDLSEQDARKMLETLRGQEGRIQRKFLKKKGENSKVGVHGKDW